LNLDRVTEIIGKLHWVGKERSCAVVFHRKLLLSVFQRLELSS